VNPPREMTDWSSFHPFSRKKFQNDLRAKRNLFWQQGLHRGKKSAENDSLFEPIQRLSRTSRVGAQVAKREEDK